MNKLNIYYVHTAYSLTSKNIRSKYEQTEHCSVNMMGTSARLSQQSVSHHLNMKNGCFRNLSHWTGVILRTQ